MSTNINLLLRIDEESLKRKKRIKILNFIAFMLLIGVGCLSLILFMLIQINNTSGIKKEQDDILGKISQSQGKRIKLFVLNNRINNIQEILGKRKDLSKTMNTIFAKIPNGLSIEGLEIDDKVISLRAQSTSLFTIGELINNLTDMVRKKEIISSLTLNSLVFDESKNSYQVSIKSEL